MNIAIKRFSDYTLTDKGLEYCLKKADYGMQYVLKTELACSKAEIISYHDLSEKELDDADMYGRDMRNKCKNIINEASILYRNNGEYLDQLVKRVLLNREKGMKMKDERFT